MYAVHRQLSGVVSTLNDAVPPRKKNLNGPGPRRNCTTVVFSLDGVDSGHATGSFDD
jgi:hypothetical protein